MAERVGFEPTIGGYPIHTFQACAFDHSATAPRSDLTYRALRYLRSIAVKQSTLHSSSEAIVQTGKRATSAKSHATQGSTHAIDPTPLEFMLWLRLVAVLRG